MNLLDFSKMVQTFFEGSFISSFQNWEAAFEYITGKISDEKLVLIIDEFPFLAEPNPSIKSIFAAYDRPCLERKKHFSYIMWIQC